jgi:glycosyltransferase involved in cell wall biosynthesis
MQIHQFHPALSEGDAIGNQIQSLHEILRQLGYRGEIWCEQRPWSFRGRVRLIAQYERFSSPENILLLHYSQYYSSETMRWLWQIPDRKVLIYHNITPAAYFAGFNEVYAERARLGRAQLPRLAALTEAGWGVSQFNAGELAELGWPKVGVLPIVVDPRRCGVRADRGVLRRLNGGYNVLFVGRIVPNKRFEDLIAVFYYLKRFLRRDSRLVLVGSASGMETYLAFLRALVSRLGLTDVVFAGHVSASELAAYYRVADVYLSMSEHEGFGVPLVECMLLGVPVVAYRSAAVPETLGQSGLLIQTRDHASIAGLLGLLSEDRDLAHQIVAQQRERCVDFAPARIREVLRGLLQGLEA